jgi:hypothetical protein
MCLTPEIRKNLAECVRTGMNNYWDRTDRFIAMLAMPLLINLTTFWLAIRTGVASYYKACS